MFSTAVETPRVMENGGSIKRIKRFSGFICVDSKITESLLYNWCSASNDFHRIPTRL